MSQEDIPTIERWSEPWHLPENTLRVAFETFGELGCFLVGEYEGKLAASQVVLPWSEKFSTTSFLYVEPSFRNTKPFASRIIQESRQMSSSNGPVMIGDSVLTQAEYQEKIGAKANPTFFVAFNTFLFNTSVKTSQTPAYTIDWTICSVNTYK